MRALVTTGLAALCALAVAAALRPLALPPPDWATLAAAAAVLVAVAWLLRLVRPPWLRLVATVPVALAVPVLAIGRDTGRWPVQEDVGGPDGYLGPLGYLADASASVRAMALGWVQTGFPIDRTAEADAAAALAVLGGLLALAAVVAVIAFRSPLPAILAVAAAAATGTLVTTADHVGVQAVLLAALAVALLLLVGDAPRGRGPVALGAVALVVATACVVGPPLARDAAWSWRTWTLEEPPAVGVGFVWDQSLQPIRFEGAPVPVLRVDSREAGYLRVAALSRYDGLRWTTGAAFGNAATGETIDIPEAALPQAARVGERPVRRVVIRNLQLASTALPLPSGTIAVDGLPDEVRPVTADSSGAVRLITSLPLGARYEVQTVKVPVTPELLDADVLGAPLDPALSVIDAIPATGRNADGDPAAPWSPGADERAAKQTQPGPFGKVALDAARPPRGPDALAAAQPAALDVALAGMVFPGFATPGRERQVQRLLRQRIALGGPMAVPVAGWRNAYGVARRVTAEATTPYQAAVLLEDWFQRTSTYDETASYTASPTGPLPNFVLDENRRGSCQYFAGAMAVLLRMLGVPARLAVGFTQGKLDGGGRVITNRNAHAWVEVRFPFAGWVAFEPTPGRALPTTTSSTSPSFAASAAGVGGAALATIVGRGDRPGGPAPQRGGTGTPVAAPDPGRSLPWPLLVVLAAVVLAALAATAVWLRKRRAERAAFAADDPDAAARALRDVVGDWLADQGAGRPDAGVADIAAAVRRGYGVDATAWADALVRAGFAPPAEARRAVGDARRETRVVLERMRARSDRRERLRGAVRPRR